MQERQCAPSTAQVDTEAVNQSGSGEMRSLPSPSERINDLHQARRFAELEQLCRHIIAHHPSDEDAWVALGAALIEQRQPALEICQKAVLLFPNNSAAHGNLGAAQTAAGLRSQAMHSARSAIALKPDHAQAHYNLANCLRIEFRHEEAEHHYKLAIAHLDQLYSAHHNLGLCLKAQGRFEEAQQVLRRAIQKLALRIQTQGQTAHSLAAPPTPIDQSRARQVLAVLCEQLTQSDIPCCLFAGTLLGIYRNGDILPHDKDLDLAIPTHIDRQRIIDAVARLEQFQFVISFGTEEERLWRDSMSLLHTESALTIDLFFLHDDGDTHFLAGAYHPQQSILCRLPRFSFTPYLWHGQSWLIPSDPERYLAAVYGAQWRIPDAQFDTIISNPSRIQAAYPVVLCYAYSHLFHAINHANWKRGYHLCLQSLVLHNDPLLVELRDWTEALYRSDERAVS